MSDLHNIEITGRLGADPKLERTLTGKSVLKMSVASDERTKKSDGTWQNEATWYRVSFWGPRAEGLAKFLKKGRGVYAAGNFVPRSYTAKDGSVKWLFEINASSAGPTPEPGRGATEQPASADDGNTIGDPIGPVAGDDEIPF